MELDKIIRRIENEHIIIEDEPMKEKQIDIKQEEDSNQFEISYSAKLMPGSDNKNNNLKQANHDNGHQGPNQEEASETVSKEYSKNIKNEIDMIHDIGINMESVNFYIEEEDTLQQDSIILEKAMNMSHIKDKQD